MTDYVFYPASPLVTTKCVVIYKYFDTCFAYNGEVEECCFVAVYSKKGERGLESVQILVSQNLAISRKSPGEDSVDKTRVIFLSL